MPDTETTAPAVPPDHPETASDVSALIAKQVG